MDTIDMVAKAIEAAIDMAQPPPGEDWEPQLHAREFASAAIDAMRWEVLDALRKRRITDETIRGLEEAIDVVEDILATSSSSD